MRYHKKNVSLGYDYLDSTNKPSVAGLARHLNCSRQAIYDWVHSYDEFRDMAFEIRKKNVIATGVWIHPEEML